jgi:hypothetical protein
LAVKFADSSHDLRKQVQSPGIRVAITASGSSVAAPAGSGLLAAAQTRLTANKYRRVSVAPRSAVAVVKMVGSMTTTSHSGTGIQPVGCDRPAGSQVSAFGGVLKEHDASVPA